jgi:hypothetical protein
VVVPPVPSPSFVSAKMRLPSGAQARESGMRLPAM